MQGRWLGISHATVFLRWMQKKEAHADPFGPLYILFSIHPCDAAKPQNFTMPYF